MNVTKLMAVVLWSLGIYASATFSASAPQWDETKVISEATGGLFNARKGAYFDKDCNESTQYEAEVIDLNQDGQPEVFTQVFGTCLGGGAGVQLNLFIKNKTGQWQPQFGFPGMYTILKTQNKGYPDIEIGGPGFCFPIWRWNGQEYAIHKRCEP